MSPPKSIKLSQTVWELWPAQEFSIRGDMYIIEKERVLYNRTCLLVLIYASCHHLHDFFKFLLVTLLFIYLLFFNNFKIQWSLPDSESCVIPLFNPDQFPGFLFPVVKHGKHQHGILSLGHSHCLTLVPSLIYSKNI